MKIIKFNPKNKKEVLNAVASSVEVLKNGGTVVHPTDTCYGVAADINNSEAIKKVYELKKRDFEKPFFIIVPNINQFKKFGYFNSSIKKIIEDDVEKMNTFVVSRKKTVPNYLNPGLKTIGIQIPKYFFSLGLLKELGNPVIGTSANVSGQPAVYSVEELMNQLNSEKKYPDLILDAGKMPKKNPSNVIRIKRGKVEILR